MEPDSKTALDLLLWNCYRRDIFLNSLCALFEFFAKQNFNRGIIKLNTFFSIYSSFSVKIVFRIHNFIQNYQMRRKHKIWGTEVEGLRYKTPLSQALLQTYLIWTIHCFRIEQKEQDYNLEDYESWTSLFSAWRFLWRSWKRSFFVSDRV